jgi:hypothetical protein
MAKDISFLTMSKAAAVLDYCAWVFILPMFLSLSSFNTLVITLMVLNTRLSLSISVTSLKVTLQLGSCSLLESLVTDLQSSFRVGLM